MPFEEVIRARCEPELRGRIVRLLRQPEHRGRDEATLIRMAVEDYCTAQEERLRLGAIREEEVDELIGLLAADRPSRKLASPTPARRPVIYHISKKKK